MGIVLKLYFSLITTLVECLTCGKHLMDICEIDKPVDKLIILTFRMYSVGDSVPSRKLLAPFDVAAIDVIPGGEWGSGVGSVLLPQGHQQPGERSHQAPFLGSVPETLLEVCSPPSAQLESTVLLRPHSCMVAVRSVKACAMLVFRSKTVVYL